MISIDFVVRTKRISFPAYAPPEEWQLGEIAMTSSSDADDLPFHHHHQSDHHQRVHQNLAYSPAPVAMRHSSEENPFARMPAQNNRQASTGDLASSTALTSVKL